MSEARRLRPEQIEERRKNLAFIRENMPGDPDGDHMFTTTLLMQEEWLATVDALLAQPEGAREAVLAKAVTWALDNHKLPPYIRRHLQDALADTSPAALLAQGELAKDIETLREMAHDFYEGGRPITTEQLDAFCAVGPTPEEDDAGD